jgi:PAS domain S-box-containing protein
MLLLKTLFQFIREKYHETIANKNYFWPSMLQDELLDSLQDTVLVVDQLGVIQYVNQCWFELTGCYSQDAIGKQIESFLHPEDIASWSKAIQQLPERQHQLIWCRVLSSAGNIHWCEIRMQMMSASPSSHISATICDITSQVRSDNIRQADHRSLTTIVNRLPAIIYRARNNKNWSMEYVSNGCFELTGYQAEQLVNQTQLSFASLIHPKDSDTVWEHVQNALQTQSVFDLHYRLIHADGHIINVSEKGQGIYSDTGAILGVEGIIFQQHPIFAN